MIWQYQPLRSVLRVCVCVSVQGASVLNLGPSQPHTSQPIYFIFEGAFLWMGHHLLRQLALLKHFLRSRLSSSLSKLFTVFATCTSGEGGYWLWWEFNFNLSDPELLLWPLARPPLTNQAIFPVPRAVQWSRCTSSRGREERMRNVYCTGDYMDWLFFNDKLIIISNICDETQYRALKAWHWP